MLIAVDPVRFGPKAMAEIRGFTDGEGKSPFWDAVGSKFFHMDYRKADVLSARDHRFIADLMPRLKRETRSVGWHGLLLAAGIAVVAFGSGGHAH